MERSVDAVRHDDDLTHWAYARVDEWPQADSPCMVIYDYFGPYDSVMLPETIEGLPVAGISLLNEDWEYDEEVIHQNEQGWKKLQERNPLLHDWTLEPVLTLYYSAAARWLNCGDFWAELESVDGACAIAMIRVNPYKRLWRMSGVRCTRLCAATDCAIYDDTYRQQRILFMDRDGVWAEKGTRGLRVDGPDDTWGVYPEVCRLSNAYSLEDIRDDALTLGEHGRLSYYVAYWPDYGMGINVGEFIITRNDGKVTIELGGGTQNYNRTVDYAAFCRGISALGLGDLTCALDDMGVEWDRVLLEPR